MERFVKRIIIFSACVIFSNFYSQLSICGLTSDEINRNAIECLLSNQSNKSKIVNAITDEIGIYPNFVFKSCPSTMNAMAVINPAKNNARYILFDYKYFGSLYENNPASTIFIIAHEIGHHINGHTIPKKITSMQELQQRELEADYFAGFILFRLGFAESDIFTIIRKLPSSNNVSSSHPINERRLDFALRGFLNEANKFKANVYRLKGQFKEEQQGKMFDDLLKSINDYAIKNETRYLDVASYILSKIENESSTIKKLEAYVNYKKGNYIDALDFYKNEFITTKDEENLEFFLDILSKTSYTSSEVEVIIKDITEKSDNPVILNSLGIYYKQIGNSEKGKQVLKRAYDKIKNGPESILKSDILFNYGRTFYDKGLQKSNSSTFAKTLFLKSKQILDKYPDELYYRLYYNSILFHLGNTQMMDRDYIGALHTYNLLLEREKNRTDYIYKTNANIANIYYNNEDYQEAIQYFTNAINAADDSSLQVLYYYQRGRAYLKNKNTELAVKDLRLSCKNGLSESCRMLDQASIKR